MCNSTNITSASDTSYIVYFDNKKPDCVWLYYHNPSNINDIFDINNNIVCKKKGYGVLYGYWNDDNEFINSTSNNHKLMTFEEFIYIVPPNKDHIKIYSNKEDFILDCFS